MLQASLLTRSYFVFSMLIFHLLHKDVHQLIFFISSSALASPEFEGREGEDLGQHLAHKLAEAYQNHAVLDLSSLCVIPGQQCWVLYVDALVCIGRIS